MMEVEYNQKEKVLKEVEEKEKREFMEEYRFRSDEELSFQLPTQEKWIVKDLIADESINVLSGTSSVGKSWLSINLLYSISEGISFLGRFDTKKSKCLYLDRENGLNELLQRRMMVIKGLGIDGSDNLYFNSEYEFNLDYQRDLEILERFITLYNIKFLVIDTFRRVTNLKENSADDISGFFSKLKRLVEKTKVTILLLHHHRKGLSNGNENDRLRGSSDLVNYVDSVIQLERKGKYLVLKQTKNRKGKEIEPLNIEIETDQNTYFNLNYQGVRENLELLCVKALQTWIVENDIDEFRYKDGWKNMKEKGYSETTFKSALRKLQNLGKIEKGKHKFSPYLVNKGIIQEVLA